ncbi:hypothetical protein [Pseudomonas yamanorum]|uniref:hypothetical protein n=1 Tax=Pseudomonas yamanorum TaxID=515393 RepID=UPI000B8962AC|nr:hypothetical protein [Pseudomonas yamanorum]
MGDLVQLPRNVRRESVQTEQISPSALVRKILVPGYDSEELDTIAHIKGYLISRKIKFSATSKFVLIEKSAQKHTLVFAKQKLVVVLFSPKGKVDLLPGWRKVAVEFEPAHEVIDYSSIIINAIEEKNNG